MGLLSLGEKLNWACETKICSWLKLPPAPNGLVQGGSECQSNAQGIRAEPQSTASPQGILKLSVAGVSLRKKPKLPREGAGVEPWSGLPLDNRIKAHPPAPWLCPEVLWHSSLLPHSWHPDLGSWVVLLHLELCFLALEFGDYCSQFPFVGRFKSSSEPEGGTNPGLGCFCEPQNACETKEGATWNRSCGGTDRDKNSMHSSRKRQESREVWSFQLSAFLIVF